MLVDVLAVGLWAALFLALTVGVGAMLQPQEGKAGKSILDAMANDGIPRRGGFFHGALTALLTWMIFERLFDLWKS